jgi:hypothetical protein
MRSVRLDRHLSSHLFNSFFLFFFIAYTWSWDNLWHNGQQNIQQQQQQQQNQHHHSHSTVGSQTHSFLTKIYITTFCFLKYNYYINLISSQHRNAVNMAIILPAENTITVCSHWQNVDEVTYIHCIFRQQFLLVEN